MKQLTLWERLKWLWLPVYFYFHIDEAQTLLTTPLFGISWAEWGRTPRMYGLEKGYWFGFWPTFSVKGGDLLYRFNLERKEFRPFPHVYLMGRERI